MRNDEPACWSWSTPPLETAETFLARLHAVNAKLPSCDRRDPAVVKFIDFETERFTRFHDGRCAICGRRGDPQVDDHCHETGQIRGRLCRSCNALEGKSSHPAIEAYRRRHPAAILGYYAPYDDGVSWIGGWPVVEYGASARERGLRPATPWPSYES